MRNSRLAVADLEMVKVSRGEFRHGEGGKSWDENRVAATDGDSSRAKGAASESPFVVNHGQASESHLKWSIIDEAGTRKSA